jgi:magnesium chelatase family protein
MVGCRPEGRSAHRTTPSARPVSSAAVSLRVRGRSPTPTEELFLDEVDRFRRDAVEALRAPLHRGEVVVGRGGRNMVFPSRLLLVAGVLDDRRPSVETVVDRLEGRAGGVADALDIRIAVAPPTAAEIAGDVGECSAAVRERVVAARRLAEIRLGDGRCNAEMGRAEIRRIRPDVGATRLLAAHRVGAPLGDRATDPILKVAQTLADLDGTTAITRRHLEEAISLR